MLAEFFLVGFTLIVLSISSCSWSKFSLFWNSFCHIALISERVALLSEINAIWQKEHHNKENFTDLSEAEQLQLLMDNTIKVKPTKENSASVARLEGLSRRLMFKLHIKRTKLLESDGDKIQTTMKKRI